MQSPTTKQQRIQHFVCPQLPLAVYREVAAHLRQVEGIDATPVVRSTEHDPAENFDYYQSQVAALQVSYAEDIAQTSEKQVADILDYYGRCYYPWIEQTLAQS